MLSTGFIVFTVYIMVMAALAHFVDRMRRNYTRTSGATEVLCDLTFSVLAGSVTCYFAQMAGLPLWVTVIAVSVSAHVGARFLFQMQNLITDKLLGRGE